MNTGEEAVTTKIRKFKIRVKMPAKPGGKPKYTIEPAFTQTSLLQQECAKNFQVIYNTARLASLMARNDQGTKFTEKCLQALEKLASNPVTYSLLESTKAYHQLKSWHKHPVAAISKKSFTILKAWRKLKHAALKWASNRAIQKECERAEQDEIRALDPRRLQIRQRIVKALSKVHEELLHPEEWRGLPTISSDISKVAKEVECELFLKLGPMLPRGPGKYQYRAIMFNLGAQKNPDFRRAILLGHIKPQQLPTLKREDMANEELKRQYQHLLLKKQEAKRFLDSELDHIECQTEECV